MADNYSVKYIFEAINRMTNNLDDIKKNLRGMDNQFEDTAKRAKTLSQKMESAGRSIRNFGNKMRYVSLAVAGAGAASLYAFGNMEKGLVNVQTLMNKDDIKRFTKDLETMQESVIADGFSIEDTNKALFDMVSALGINSQSSKTFADAHKLAVGGVTSLGVSVDGITSIINAYGREVTNSNDVANAFFTSQKFGKTTVELLASNIGKVAPIAKAAGIGFKELLATTSALTLGGLSTEESVTALRASISALIDPPKEAVPILNKLGISFGVAGFKGKGLRTILAQIVEANKKYPQAVAAAIPNIRAFTGLMALSGDKLKIIDETMQQIETDIKNNTGLTEAYNVQQQTLNDSLTDLKGNLLLIGKEFGEILAPYVKDVTDGVKQLVTWFKALDPSIKSNIVAFGAFVAILSPLLIGLASMISLFTFIGTAAFTVSLSILTIAGGVASLIIYWNELIDALKVVWYWMQKVGSYMVKFATFGAIDTTGNYKDMLPEQFSSPELAMPTKVRGEEFLLNSNNMSQANVNVNLNAPKGTVKNYSSETIGSGMKLGVNMGGS